MSSKPKGEPSDHDGASKLPGRLPPGLYVVATPLGNLGDISRRAIEVLSQADIVACEDTRVTGKLLQLLGLRAPRLMRYDDHADDRARATLVEAVRAGKAVALVSDAGTPLVADPGYRLVRAMHAADLRVSVVPGPSAAIAALCIAGLPTDRFLCAGFLPQKPGARRKALAELAAVPATLVLFEAPHRLADSLADMAEMLGPREAVVARELTKLFEETRRGRLDELAAHYQAAPDVRGEIVVVVAPAEPSATAMSEAELDAKLQDALAEASVRDAATAVAAATGLPRRQVYARAVALSKERR